MNDLPPKKPRVDEKAEKMLLTAIQKYMDDGRCEVICDLCQSPIHFERLNEFAWTHHCECGKFNGSLRA